MEWVVLGAGLAALADWGCGFRKESKLDLEILSCHDLTRDLVQLYRKGWEGGPEVSSRIPRDFHAWNSACIPLLLRRDERLLSPSSEDYSWNVKVPDRRRSKVGHIVVLDLTFCV